MIRVLMIVGMVFFATAAQAQEGSHLFDDLNGNGISDADEKAAADDSASTTPSQETDDANQPTDDEAQQ